MQATFDLPPEKVDLLVRAFSPSRFANPQDLIDELMPMMATAWIDWVSGEKRYGSLTEQYVDWIEQIYTQVLPEDEPPSAERLFNSFNMPYGQAQYVARVLNNRSQAHWRKFAVEQLKELLASRLEDARQWITHDAGDKTIELSLTRPAFQELGIAIEELFRQNPDQVDIPLKSASSHNLLSVRITARTLVAVYGYLNP